MSKDSETKPLGILRRFWRIVQWAGGGVALVAAYLAFEAASPNVNVLYWQFDVRDSKCPYCGSSMVDHGNFVHVSGEYSSDTVAKMHAKIVFLEESYTYSVPSPGNTRIGMSGFILDGLEDSRLATSIRKQFLRMQNNEEASFHVCFWVDGPLFSKRGQLLDRFHDQLKQYHWVTVRGDETSLSFFSDPC